MVGTTEIIIIVGVVLVLFGARAIPKFARSVGKAKHEFEKGAREGAAGEETGDDKEDDASARAPSEKERENGTRDNSS
ncbi:MAG: twin-arginine translocase TatA/TatE family subunit [Spirochaetaceae bacterium]